MLIVGELINASRKSIAGFIEAKDSASIGTIARVQKEAGADFIDVNAGIFVGQEARHLQWLVETVQSNVSVPCCIDSPDPHAIEAALDAHKGAAMINSISLEKKRFDRLLPVVAHTDLKVVALCMSDKGIPPGGLDEYFQTPQTLNETWGYSKFDTLWKSPEEVIQQLVQVVSRGGNYLLNVGPQGDGTIPEATVNVFKKVGEWVTRNAESIYGTSATPFGELEWGYCTQKENKLYLFVRNWDKREMISLNGLKNQIFVAYPLVNPSLHLPVMQKNKTTNIELTGTEPDHPLSVIVLELEEKPEAEPPKVIQQESGKIELDYLNAITYGNAMTRFNRKGGFHISKWKCPDDKVQWWIKIDNPGKYKITVRYSAEKSWEGKPYEISINQSKIEIPVVPTMEIFEYHSFPAGYINVREPGEYSLIMHPKVTGDSYFMHLQSVILEPAKKIKTKGWGIH